MRVGFKFDEDSAVMVPETETTSSMLTDALTLTTATLAKKIQNEMEEMTGLLSKLKTGTATREEIKKLKELGARLSEMKKDAKMAIDTTVSELKASVYEKGLEYDKALKEKEIRSVIKSVSNAEAVDLAFLLDCTESMSPYIDSVKKSINKIISCVKRTNGSLKLRLAMIAYRDVGDLNRFEVFDFTSSVPDFERFVEALRATGGADVPEDIAGAIRHANNLCWIHPTRVVFLIADSPCHGRQFHKFSVDDYPEGTPGIDIISELKNLQLSHKTHGSINLTFGRITEYTDEMIQAFRKQRIEISVVDINQTDKLTSAVTSSVRSSILKTMTVTSGGTRVVSFAPAFGSAAMLKTGAVLKDRRVKMKDFRITPGLPSIRKWEEISPVKVNIYQNAKIDTIEHLKGPIAVKLLNFFSKCIMTTEKTTKDFMFARVANEPFAEGEIRIAYHGQLARSVTLLNEKESIMVMKSFKHRGEGIHDRKQYFQQMEVSNIAHFLANLYNLRKRPSHCKKIVFLEVCVLEFVAKKGDDEDTRFCAERPLPLMGATSFTKYCNNTGHWDPEKLDESLLHFSEWSLEVTDGYLMISDLQGIEHDGMFCLTDPVVLCADITRFGHTNLGPKFIQKSIQTIKALKKEKGWL